MVGLSAGDDAAGGGGGGISTWAGAVADCITVGWTVVGWTVVGWTVVGDEVGDWCVVVPVLLFDAVGGGVGWPEAEAVAVGALAVVTFIVGEPPAVDVTLQPATTPTTRQAPIAMPVVVRPPLWNRMPITICHHPLRSPRAESNEPNDERLAIPIC
jgi:hypothetical protein